MNLWQKIDYLVPVPHVHMVDDVVIAWKDARPQPTQAELNAVTQANVDSREEDIRVDENFRSEREDTLLMLLYLTDERLRVLESRPVIDKPTFWNQIKNVHKNQQFFDF